MSKFTWSFLWIHQAQDFWTKVNQLNRSKKMKAQFSNCTICQSRWRVFMNMEDWLCICERSRIWPNDYLNSENTFTALRSIFPWEIFDLYFRCHVRSIHGTSQVQQILSKISIQWKWTGFLDVSENEDEPLFLQYAVILETSFTCKQVPENLVLYKIIYIH